MARLALKIDVDTYRGTREGVPRLVELLKKHQARATFLFSLGPDHTGRAITRALRPGFMRKVSRTSVMKHYGLKTLLYGTLLPGPDIGRACAALMRQVREDGFETGIHTWDHVKWQDKVALAGADWTEQQMRLAADRFEEIFSEPARAHGAAGWQTNVHALRLTQRMGFHYSSDARGHCPFVPVVRAEIALCPQLPTTLPTLDELLGRTVDGKSLDESNVAAHILQSTRQAPESGHVFTLHAELEGGQLGEVFEALLEGWRAQGYELCSLHDLYETLDLGRLPRHEIVMGEVPGRSGQLALQGEEFLARRPA
jgi:peptidoglycan/xylan/chitin deacetylase (PgdA/CDA1 family)